MNKTDNRAKALGAFNRAELRDIDGKWLISLEDQETIREALQKSTPESLEQKPWDTEENRAVLGKAYDVMFRGGASSGPAPYHGQECVVVPLEDYNVFRDALNFLVGDCVLLPQNKWQAQMMQMVGYRYLEQQAPEMINSKE